MTGAQRGTAAACAPPRCAAALVANSAFVVRRTRSSGALATPNEWKGRGRLETDRCPGNAAIHRLGREKQGHSEWSAPLNCMGRHSAPAHGVCGSIRLTLGTRLEVRQQTISPQNSSRLVSVTIRTLTGARLYLARAAQGNGENPLRRIRQLRKHLEAAADSSIAEATSRFIPWDGGFSRRTSRAEPAQDVIDICRQHAVAEKSQPPRRLDLGPQPNVAYRLPHAQGSVAVQLFENRGTLKRPPNDAEHCRRQVQRCRRCRRPGESAIG